jgi:RNA-directed DNA polymerase
LEKIQEFAKANGLRLHPEKTQIVDAREPGGFDFLGYHFERGMRWPRKKSLDTLKEALRSKTRRTEGRSLKGDL